MELRDQLQATLGTAYTIERELTGGGMSRAFVADEAALGRKNRDSSVAVRTPDGGPTRILADRGALGGIAQRLAWGRDASTVYALVTRPIALAFLAIPVAGGPPRVILAEDPQHRFSPNEFATDGHRLFFALAAWESDVWVMDLKR